MPKINTFFFVVDTLKKIWVGREKIESVRLPGTQNFFRPYLLVVDPQFLDVYLFTVI